MLPGVARKALTSDSKLLTFQWAFFSLPPEFCDKGSSVDSWVSKHPRGLTLPFSGVLSLCLDGSSPHLLPDRLYSPLRPSLSVSCLHGSLPLRQAHGTGETVLSRDCLYLVYVS